MSSKRHDIKNLLPKRRFPSFNGVWEEEALQKVATFENEKLPVTQLSPTNYVSTENLMPDYGGVVAASKLPSSGAATRFRVGDVLVSNIRPYLKKVWQSDMDGGSSNDVIVIRAKEKIDARYFSHVLINDAFINYVMKGAKGVKMPRGDINLAKEYPFPYPPDKREQQKIADCLSSLDELIAAQAKKVEALKDYKNGLMQRLFPQEGQSTPELRFPEFRNKSKWIESKLEKYIEEFREKSSVQDEYEILTSSRGGLVKQRDYYENSRITERDNVGFNIIPPDYITYRSRSDDCLFFFNHNNLGITGIISIYYPVFRIAEGDNRFFIYLFSWFSEPIGKNSVGNAQKVLSLNELRKITLPVPAPAEQKKIADCLSSFDAAITTHSKKLDIFREHKKGLMRQLFPSLDEVKA
jgi:type I restriction enzyme, S subunit